MRNRLSILGGLVLFLALVTWPVWRALASAPVPPPTTDRPVGATRCVAPVAYMRASHMTLLAEWRDRVVRDGVREYTDADGRVVRMSLTGTCLDCHGDKATFCDRCHDYVRVSPSCWDCHVAPPRAPTLGGRQ